MGAIQLTNQKYYFIEVFWNVMTLFFGYVRMHKMLHEWDTLVYLSQTCNKNAHNRGKFYMSRVTFVAFLRNIEE